MIKTQAKFAQFQKQYGITQKQAVLVFRILFGIEGLTSIQEFVRMTQTDWMTVTEVLKTEGYWK
tara:strand:- start:4109 stop:4300 length:192 start_codon:yes stop_codon:yes gene_type:complete